MNAKYSNPNAQLFVKNRQKFAKSMVSGGIAIFHSNDEVPRNGDAYFSFRQQSDIYYLTGIDQEESTLVIIKEKGEQEIHLFIKVLCLFVLITRKIRAPYFCDIFIKEQIDNKI